MHSHFHIFVSVLVPKGGSILSLQRINEVNKHVLIYEALLKYVAPSSCCCLSGCPHYVLNRPIGAKRR